MKMNGGSTQKKKLRSSNLKTNPQLLGFVKPSFIVNKNKKKAWFLILITVKGHPLSQIVTTLIWS